MTTLSIVIIGVCSAVGIIVLGLSLFVFNPTNHLQATYADASTVRDGSRQLLP